MNPPHKPVVRSRHQGCEVELNRLNKAKITPIRKHPTRLTINVPHGKLCEQAFFIQLEMRYLNAPPTKLPRPTKHSDFIIIQLFSFYLRYKVSKKTCNYLDVTKNVGSIHALCSRDPSPSVVQSTELPSLSTERHLVFPLKASFALRSSG